MALGEILGAVGGLVGGLFGNDQAEDNLKMQIQAQERFAKQGIRWKVADATKAGIHPLYALGASTHSFSPVSVGEQDWAGIGQNIGRAAGSMVTPAEKADAYTQTAQRLTLQKMGLENDLLASQIRTLNAPGTGPGMPVARTIPGQGNSPADPSSMNLGGMTLPLNPALTPAADASNYFGEPGDWLFGVSNLIDAAVKKYTGVSADKYVLPNIPKELIVPWLTKQIASTRSGSRGAKPTYTFKPRY